MSIMQLSATYRLQNIHDALLAQNDISLKVARLDEIHPIISGNKLFKLAPYMQELHPSCKTIVTMGGSFSNHLVATASYCLDSNIRCFGLVRGEKPKTLSHTLMHCESLNMHLIYLDRSTYSNINAFNYKTIQDIPQQDVTFIPEGGYGIQGCEGASMIVEQLIPHQPSHIVTAIGTGTTFAGLIKSSPKKTRIVGIPVLKGMHDLYDRLHQLLPDIQFSAPTIFNDYHFGGYAKHQMDLIAFINQFYQLHQIPLDFVYTGKMMYGLFDQIKKGFFPKGSRIIALHTGGLQGNLSLPATLLDF